MPISHTLEEMVTKYTAKMNPTQVGTNYQNASAIAVGRYEEGVFPFFAIYPKVKNILWYNGVPAGQQGIYFAFAFKLQHYAQKQGNVSLQDIVASLQQEFVTLGAEPQILNQLANLVVG